MNLTPLARALRRNMTDAERRLWAHLRGKRPGCKFRRQAAIGPYTADFVCFEKRLVVEVDGGRHLDSARDLERDAWLAQQGFKTLRFWDGDVLRNPEGVLESIRRAVEEFPPPQPPPQGGRG
jgi:very-short-patch-repair endonuclease